MLKDTSTSSILMEPILNPLTCSPSDSLVRTSAKPEHEKASSMETVRSLAAAFSLNAPKLLGRCEPSPDGYLLRTSQASLLCPEQWQEFSGSFPDSGMTVSGDVFELRTSAPAISESASSSSAAWPTIRSSEAGDYQNQWDGTTQPTLTGAVKNWPTARREDGESCGNHPGAVDSLTGAVKTWATPNAHDGRRPGSDATSTQGANLKRDAELWTTPQAHDQSGGDPERAKRGCAEAGNKNLADDVTLWQTPAARDYRTPNRSPEQHADQLQNFVEHSLQDQMILGGHGLFKNSHGLPQHFPTPSASMATVQDLEQAATAGNSPDRPKYSSMEKRRLNPRFVEFLMGLPVGWTEL